MILLEKEKIYACVEHSRLIKTEKRKIFPRCRESTIEKTNVDLAHDTYLRMYVTLCTEQEAINSRTPCRSIDVPERAVRRGLGQPCRYVAGPGQYPVIYACRLLFSRSFPRSRSRP